MQEEIRKALMTRQEEGYRAFQCSLMPTVDPSTVLGVRTPALRRLAKEWSHTREAAELMQDLPHAYFEENQLHAFLIGRIKGFDEALAATEAFLPYVDNWATCDQLSPAAFRGHLHELEHHIAGWMASPHEYTCRFGIGMLMRYGLDADFRPEYLAAVVTPTVVTPTVVTPTVAQREEYYVRMMVAWFFATALAKQYEATLPYLCDHLLPVWTHNMTIRKACESYRVTEEHKAFLRILRRK